MAREPKRLYGPALLSSSPTEIYAAPANRKTRVRRIHAFNGSDSSVTLTISIGTDSAGTRIVDAVPIAARSQYQTKNVTLAEGETLEAFASVANEVTLTVMGKELFLNAEEEGEALRVFIGETGGYTELAADQIDNGNAILATRRTLESRYGNCTLQYLSTFLANAAGNVVLGLYDDDGAAGIPGTLLAQTAQFAAANGHNKHPVITPVSLAPGNYWLVVHVSSNAVGVCTNGTAEPDWEPSRYLNVGSFGALPSTYPGGSSDQQLSRYVYAEFTSDTLTQPAATTPPSSPPTLSGPSGKSLSGYALTFNDEFDWYDRERWNSHIFWNYSSPPDSIYCEDSVVHLDSRESDGYRDIYMDTLGFLDDIRYGYFECLMYWTHGKAAWPAFWLFSSDWSKGKGCGVNRAGELDVMEAWGPSPNINETTSINSFAGTVHNDSAGVCEANTPGPTGGNNYRDLSPTVLGDSWHKYGMLWEPTRVTWYVDDVETHGVTIGAGTTWDTLDQDMHVILYSWAEGSCFGHPGVCADGTSPDPLDVLVDWVRVWQDV